MSEGGDASCPTVGSVSLLQVLLSKAVLPTEKLPRFVAPALAALLAASVLVIVSQAEAMPTRGSARLRCDGTSALLQ